MELLDIVNESGEPTGEVVDRNIAHNEGIRHRTAHVWIVRSDNGTYQILLQKRSKEKESFPGCYDTSSAGHIKAGDEPILSAIRELGEELGLFALESDLHFIGTFNIKYEKEFRGKIFKDNEVPFVYIYSGKVEINSLFLQTEEVEDVKWFDLDYVIDRKGSGDTAFCVPSDSLKLLRSFLISRQ